MDLWQVRNQAAESLSHDLKRENEAIEKCFAIFDECIIRFFSLANSDDLHKRFALACCHTLIKARRLALGSYGLCMDGLAFEAGSFARTILEAWQLLIYFSQDTSRVELVLSDNPPTAGAVARDINLELHNDLRGLREYYNRYTSHFSLQKDALAPIVIAFDRDYLKTNMRSLFTLMLSILCDTVPCLDIVGKRDQTIIDYLRDCRNYGFQAFGIEM